MKTEVWRGQNSIRFFYYRYKDSSYFSLIIVFISIIISFLLFFKVIVSQAQNWFSLKDEVRASSERIAILRNNYIFMSNMNKKLLEDNRKLVIRALPEEKDFGEIINAVMIAAAKSGVSLEDFTFNLGLVSTDSAKMQKNMKNNEPITRLSLSMNGDIDRIKEFINEIGEKLPINQVESISIDRGSVYISLFFYSEPYVQPRVFEDEPINPLNPENNRVFGKLSEWNKSSSFEETSQIQTSSSATPLF